MNDGSELSDSCVQLSGSTFSSWTAASVGCPAGSHMLSIRSSPATVGLALFVVANVCTGSGTCFVGGSQSSTALSRNREWAWVDGTDASNLNCGVPNAVSCGLWLAGGPE